MKLHADIKYRLFYSILILFTILHVYSIHFQGINVSLFRILFVLWSIIFLKDILLSRKIIKKSYGILFGLFLLIFVINLIDWLRVDDKYMLGKDMINHIIDMSLVCLVVVYINTEKKLETAIKLYVLGSLIALLIATFSLVTGKLPFEALIREFQAENRQGLDFVIQDMTVFRFASSFYDPNFYGLYLCFVIILCIYIYNYVDKGKSLSVLVVPNIAALFLTFSRTAFLGFVVLFAVSLLLIRRFRVIVIRWIPITILVFLIFLFFNLEMVKSFVQYERYVDTSSIYKRLPYQENGLRVFADNPVVGGSTQQLLTDITPVASAHVVYLSLLAKYGLIGFSIYLVFLIYPIYYAIRKGSSLSAKYVFLIVAVYLSIFVMYLSYDFFQFLEFQYLMFGFVYSIVVNRIGLTNNNCLKRHLRIA
jgi:hypothetical protein